MKEGFMAFGADGGRLDYFPPRPPAAFDANAGGVGVDGSLKHYVTIMMKTDRSKPDYGRSTSRMFLFDEQTLLLERDVSDIIARAETIQIEAP
jgi:hypothetical protein